MFWATAQQHLQKDIIDGGTIRSSIADIVCTAICMNKLNPENRVIQFFKVGTKPKNTVKTKPNILSPSTDWEVRVDIIKYKPV